MSFVERRRASSSMIRTRSTKGFDFNVAGVSEDSQEEGKELVRKSVWGGSDMVSPRKPRRSSIDFACDLKVCGFCMRRIGAGKDIFMYRGEVGFCSMECRQEQMTIDERKDKSLLASKRNNDEYKVAEQNIAGSDGPRSGGGTTYCGVGMIDRPSLISKIN